MILYPMYPCIILALTSFYACILYAACCILYPGFSHLDVGVWAQKHPDYHPLGSLLESWLALWRVPESIKILACPQDPPKPPKCSPGSPKVTKMTPKTTPRTPN